MNYCLAKFAKLSAREGWKLVEVVCIGSLQLEFFFLDKRKSQNQYVGRIIRQELAFINMDEIP